MGQGLPFNEVSRSQRRTTVGVIPLDEESACRRELCLTTHNTHNRHPCLRWHTNPQSRHASGRRPTPLDRAATGTGVYLFTAHRNILFVKTGRPVYFAVLFMTHNLTFHNFSSSPMNCVHAINMLTQDNSFSNCYSQQHRSDFWCSGDVSVDVLVTELTLQK